LIWISIETFIRQRGQQGKEIVAVKEYSLERMCVVVVVVNAKRWTELQNPIGMVYGTHYCSCEGHSDTWSLVSYDD
jgi:hypothetical protein